MKVLRTIATLVLLAQGFAWPAHAEAVKVFAAASLKNALDDIGAAWMAGTGKQAVMVMAGSSALAKQIAEGAPADIFISADLAWMDDLESKGLIQSESRVNLLGNSLVLIAPQQPVQTVELSEHTDLVSLLAGGRLAVADVKSVPAGRYAKAALESLKLWDSVSDHLAQSENVRAALAFVARGEASLGIVYGSDAAAESNVRVTATFPANSHPPIVYPAAIVTASGNPDTAAFLSYLRSEESRKIFQSYGFTVFE